MRAIPGNPQRGGRRLGAALAAFVVAAVLISTPAAHAVTAPSNAQLGDPRAVATRTAPQSHWDLLTLLTNASYSPLVVVDMDIVNPDRLSISPGEYDWVVGTEVPPGGSLLLNVFSVYEWGEQVKFTIHAVTEDGEGSVTITRYTPQIARFCVATGSLACNASDDVAVITEADWLIDHNR